MKITRTCPITGKKNTLEIPVLESQIEMWREGMLIQDAMPNLTSDEREFIMTGLLPHVWNTLFKDEEI